MKWKILFIIFALKPEYVHTFLFSCTCMESRAQCQDVHKCLNCEFDGRDCHMLHMNFTEEQCANLLLESEFINGVEWRKHSSECRSANCTNVYIQPSDSNITVYRKTCDSGCSTFTVTKYQNSRVMTNYSAASIIRYSHIWDIHECFKSCLSLPVRDCIVTYERVYISGFVFPDYDYDCKLYPGCNTSECLLAYASGYTHSYILVCNETGLECSGVQTLSNGFVNASAGTKFGATAIYSCELGYNLSESSTRLCLGTGNWNTSAPSCSPVDCGIPIHIENGSVSFTTTTYSSVVTYSCKAGFLLVGTNIQTCQDNGQWNGFTPLCTIKDCGQPTRPGNGSVYYTTTTLGSQTTYTCNTGYFMTGSANTTCTDNGQWSDSTPTCNMIDCGVPSPLSNGLVIYTTITFKSVATYTCITGYNLTGSSITICQDNGQWSGITPTCTIIVCNPPGQTNNGLVNYTTTTFSSQATYTCNTGYFLTGFANTTCTDNGKWSDATPTCTIINCNLPSQPSNGTVSYTTTTYNSQATYTCNTGYELNGSAITTCTENGQWSGSSPTCIIIDCHLPNQPNNGLVNYTTTTFSSQATFNCNTGYELNGTPNTTCTDNGQWSGSTPICTMIDCRFPSQPINGSVNFTTTTFNSFATYNCNTGYNLYGSANTTCSVDGQWSGSAPTCTIQDCGVPSHPSNGSVNYTTSTFSSQATYNCNTGYELNGSANTNCTDNGQWSGSTPTCTIIDCHFPSHPNNGSVNYSTTTFNSSASYNCNTGYNLYGSANTTCSVDGQWSGSTPTCTIQDCGVPSHPSNGSANYTTTTYNSQATYSCNEGYDLTGAANITCTESGQWSGSTPTCAIKNCGRPRQPVNGSVNYTTTTFNSIVSYSCDEGFLLNGSLYTTCDETGNWSDPTPSCTIEDCGQPSMPDNGTVDYTTTTFNSSATYTCSAGFLLTGSSISTCNSGGNWSYLPPYCKFIDCGVPQQVENGNVYFNETTYGSHAVYVCNQGFNISGQSMRTCMANGFWVPAVPYCLAPGQTVTRPRLYIKPCICNTNRTFVNMTQDQILAHLVKETSIDTKNTSAALNKLRSRSDSRTSSAIMGTIGIVILSTIGGLILCSDLLTICKNRHAKKEIL